MDLLLGYQKTSTSFSMVVIKTIKLNILVVEQVRLCLTKFTLGFSQGEEKKSGFIRNLVKFGFCYTSLGSNNHCLDCC